MDCPRNPPASGVATLHGEPREANKASERAGSGEERDGPSAAGRTGLPLSSDDWARIGAAAAGGRFEKVCVRRMISRTSDEGGGVCLDVEAAVPIDSGNRSAAALAWWSAWSWVQSLFAPFLARRSTTGARGACGGGGEQWNNMVSVMHHHGYPASRSYRHGQLPLWMVLDGDASRARV